MTDEPPLETGYPFAHFGDKTCRHPSDQQVRDGLGMVCLNCGVIRILVVG